ncbi:hypothetical protein [Paenibacillus apiarius]|uniref:Uncharacterized protein n=1 Tax=Paenibacillus apiarius TaxID=46240 RepID=A0ABT4DRP9_9BACL|nr:hypothetical protein [Paenibacillus apiarius]MCY9515281.1 hypothetical protein [Paenibacillus apiarius]MCY9520030.1 hypothetical protein [Paenibacillus apiarius]MCY9554347.1 hypothetical protein [Paenibacillus apiarius]MCY9558138.1 hypothetical protein [Paenibacillus apiarius]MCY9684933.1 hypothetical protein [Paenibacillus apiarius]
MKIKEWALSIVIHAFLGYLWVLFVDHAWGIANSMDNMILGGLILLLGTYLFWFTINRITPFNSYQLTQPVKIAGIISFGLVVIVLVLVCKVIT